MSYNSICWNLTNSSSTTNPMIYKSEHFQISAQIVTILKKNAVQSNTFLWQVLWCDDEPKLIIAHTNHLLRVIFDCSTKTWKANINRMLDEEGWVTSMVSINGYIYTGNKRRTDDPGGRRKYIKRFSAKYYNRQQRRNMGTRQRRHAGSKQIGQVFNFRHLRFRRILGSWRRTRRYQPVFRRA